MFNALNSLITSGSGVNLLIIMIIVPAFIALVTILIPKQNYFARAILFLLTTVVNLIFAISLFVGDEMTMLIPWADFGINLSLRVYDFSQFMVLAAACFAFLESLSTCMGKYAEILISLGSLPASLAPAAMCSLA